MAQIFYILSRKILILLRLGRGYRFSGVQNLDSKYFTRKIFWNKELSANFCGPRATTSETLAGWRRFARMI